jgi:nitrile hydratase accessory protein
VKVDLGPLELANLPRDATGPVFREPWEAQAFALVVDLQAHRLFTWSEWAEALGTEIRNAQLAGDPDLGDSYYRHWLAALERLVVETGMTDENALVATRAAWDRAAKATPHGRPILLDGPERQAPYRGAVQQ